MEFVELLGSVGLLSSLFGKFSAIIASDISSGAHHPLGHQLLIYISPFAYWSLKCDALIKEFSSLCISIWMFPIVPSSSLIFSFTMVNLLLSSSSVFFYSLFSVKYDLGEFYIFHVSFWKSGITQTYVWILGWFQWLIFFSLWVVFSCMVFFGCQTWWILSYWEFFFFFLYVSSSVFPGMHLSYLEKIWSLLVLLLWFVIDRSSSPTNYPPDTEARLS